MPPPKNIHFLFHVNIAVFGLFKVHKIYQEVWIQIHIIRPKLLKGKYFWQRTGKLEFLYASKVSKRTKVKLQVSVNIKSHQLWVGIHRSWAYHTMTICSRRKCVWTVVQLMGFGWRQLLLHWPHPRSKGPHGQPEFQTSHEKVYSCHRWKGMQKTGKGWRSINCNWKKIQIPLWRHNF